MRLQVRGPTTPSATNKFLAWKFFTAASVNQPKTPSTETE
jgi:hypothetical protein